MYRHMASTAEFSNDSLASMYTMNQFRRLLRLSTAALIAAAFPSAAGATSSLAVLPLAGPVEARVMQLRGSPELEKISAKLEASMRSQPEWLMQYIEQHARPGKPLPYHANFGITQAEYARVLASPKEVVLAQVGTVSLSAERQADGSIRLRTKPASRIDGLRIDAGEKTVTAPLARLTETSAINQDQAQSPTGRWTGTQWRHSTMQEDHVLSLKLAIGKRIDHGDGIIYYNVKNIRPGNRETYDEVLLFPAAVPARP